MFFCFDAFFNLDDMPGRPAANGCVQARNMQQKIVLSLRCEWAIAG